MSVKINTLEVENLKRIKAVKLRCDHDGLTLIGGRNGQGKTSVLDAITYALGGERYRPSEVKREGSMVDPKIKIELSNGLIVERKGKNTSLKVTDPSGKTSGQSLLNSFVSQLALDLPKFLSSSPKEKVDQLLQIIGVGDQLFKLEQEEKSVYDTRRAVGQVADQKTKHAAELEHFPDAPTELLSIRELIDQQQAILLKNGENQKLREDYAKITRAVHVSAETVERLKEQINSLQSQLDREEQSLASEREKQTIAQKTVQDLQDESTAELEAQIKEMDDINAKVRANLSKEKAIEDADVEKNKYDALTEKIEKLRDQKVELLNDADLPLEGLSVQDGELTFQGKAWDCMSGSEQLRVATAIVRKLNPKCGFVLVDEAGRMDPQTLAEFGEWAEQTGLQVIATRPSTGPECSIVIEDGSTPDQADYVPTTNPAPPPAPVGAGSKWEGGF